MSENGSHRYYCGGNVVFPKREITWYEAEMIVHKCSASFDLIKITKNISNEFKLLYFREVDDIILAEAIDCPCLKELTERGRCLSMYITPFLDNWQRIIG